MPSTSSPQPSPVTDYRFTSHGFADPVLESGKRVHTYKGAYVALTSQCNTDICTYCYARDQKTHERTMPLNLFAEVLQMLEDISDFPEVYLVGGEPTVLKDLSSYLALIELRSWNTTIYTNGGFGAEQLEVIQSSPSVNRISFHYDPVLFSTFDWLRPRWELNLNALSSSKEVSIVGVIDGPTFPFSELVDLAATCGASFSWIFATPTSGNTPYLGLAEMRSLGPQVQTMLLDALEKGVRCAPDLPVPLCIFDPAFLRTYADTFALIRKCKPFAYFNVDGRVSFCTAMPIYTAPRPTSSAQLAEIIEHHRQQDALLKERPTFPECVTCEQHLKRTCQGGCMTYKVYAKNGTPGGGTSGASLKTLPLISS